MKIPEINNDVLLVKPLRLSIDEAIFENLKDVCRSSKNFYISLGVRIIWRLEMPRSRIDLAAIYRMLLCLKENNGSLNITQLIKCSKSSASTVERYVEIMKARGLVIEEVNRERRIKITRKGEDYIFLFSRILALIGE